MALLGTLGRGLGRRFAASVGRFDSRVVLTDFNGPNGILTVDGYTVGGYKKNKLFDGYKLVCFESEASSAKSTHALRCQQDC